MKIENAANSTVYNLALSQKMITLQAPMFYVGQEVHLIDCHLSMQSYKVTGIILFYIAETDDISLFVAAPNPKWRYLLANESRRSETEYEEYDLLCHEKWLDHAQSMIDDQSLALISVIELFYNHGLKIGRKDIQAMWDALDGVEINFPVDDLKETARIFLTNPTQRIL